MPGFLKSKLTWLNGGLVPWDEATVNVSAHGLQYGTGVFEGMRAYDTSDGPAIFRLDAHMRRLAESARHYEMELPYDFETLCDAARSVVRANGLSNAYLRPLAFFDSHSFAVWPRDCPVSVAIIAVAGKPYLAGGATGGVRVMVSTTRRIDESTLPPYVKACGHYMNSVRAGQEALRAGFDDAILLNSRGEVAEGSGANLFVVRDGTLVTNEIDASIVMGITRDSVLRIARDLGVAVSLRPITVEDLRGADELFFSGTAVEIVPITHVDGRPVRSGQPGGMTVRLRETFFDAVHGRLPQYREWLSFTAG
jgi:branched-chain amino acid aminotransferase